MRAPRFLIPFAALLAIVPLLLHGPSCGHDFDFHLLNWLEASRQIGAGQYPHWAFIPAYHAGEPRFIFYPPLSWLTGAALTALLPFRLTPAAYTFTCLTLSGFSFFRLARIWAAEPAATLAAIFYLLNPYSLFTAYERTAYAELLAAAVIPLLFAAILRPRPTIAGITLPVALLWLTNAPAAVMSTYALALLTTVRLLRPGANSAGAPANAHLPDALGGSDPLPTRWRLARTALAGTALGLALPAFYLLPAAYERRWVEIDMAVIEGLRPADNFLFHHTPDAAHDAVLHTASLLAVMLLALAAAALFAARRKATTPYLLPALTTLAAVIAFLLTGWSAPLWNHLPELRFLQFPWRMLALLACTLALAATLAVRNLRLRPVPLALASTALAGVLIFHPAPHREPGLPLLTPEFTQGCEPAESPVGRQQLTPALANTAPTDEYTPAGVDNDALRPGDPPYWTIPQQGAADLDQPAPRGLPAGGAPDHFTVEVDKPTYLVVNRREYPAWRVMLNGQPTQPVSPAAPYQPERQDGLMVLLLPAGRDRIDLTFAQTPDRLLGELVSLAALILFLLAVRARRKA